MEFSDGVNAATAEAELARLQREEEAFQACRRADSPSAVEKFLSDHPESHYVGEARALHSTLLARETAYESALADGQPATFKALLKPHPTDVTAAELRRRLPQLEPAAPWSRRNLLIGSAAGIGVLGVALTIFNRRESAKPEPAVRNRATPAPVTPPSRQLQVLSGATEEIDFAGFSPDGSRVITSAIVGAVRRLWNVRLEACWRS